MNTQRLLYILAVAGLEIAAILLFWLVFSWLPDAVYYLDLAVITVVIAGWAFSIKLPLVDINDPSQKQVASLGAKWFSISAYSTIALIVGALGIVGEFFDFHCATTQIVVQAILLILFLIGILTSSTMQNKAEQTYMREQCIRADLDNMRLRLDLLAEAANTTPGMNRATIAAAESLINEARYISPQGTPRATALEQQIAGLAAETARMISIDSELNARAIDENIARCATLITSRRRMLR